MTMDARQELPVQKKREHETREETTIPARVFVPTADIFESKDALMVVLEMPGVDKSNFDCSDARSSAACAHSLLT
jgi:HSP20 family molecular chaperone IbpA